MAEDIGEGGGVPGGGGAPFVARVWPAAWTRTPSGARAPPLLRLLLLGRSAGELAPPRSRTVTALPSNAKERERISRQPGARAAEAGGREAAARSPSGGCGSCRCSGLNLPSRSRCRHHSRRRRRRPVPIARSRRLRLVAPSPSHLCQGRGAEGREGAAAWGRGADRAALSPGSLLSRAKVYFRSASLCLWFHFLFPDHDSNTIEGNHI